MILFASNIFSSILTIVIILLMITFLVATHELGHLLVAKKFNIYCAEYSIGMGPIIYKNTKHETQFSIRAFPIGGYVKIAGEDEQELKDKAGNPIPKERTLNNVAPYKKLLVLLTGGLVNLLTALLCFYLCLAISGGFYTPDNRVMIQDDSLLAIEGMKTGDYITKVTTKKGDEEASFTIRYYDELIAALNVNAPSADGETQEIEITYHDMSKTVGIYDICTVTRTASLEGDELVISKIGVSNYFKSYTPLTALYGQFEYMGIYFKETLRAFGQMFTGNFSNLTGIIGIYKPVNEVVSSQAYAGTRALSLLSMFGAISFSLGFINLVPFPALDGGRIFFTLLEMIRGGKKLKPEIESKINMIGLIIILGLIAFVTFKDIFNLF